MILTFISSPLIIPMCTGQALAVIRPRTAPRRDDLHEICTTYYPSSPAHVNGAVFNEPLTSADKGGPTNLRLGLGVAIAGCVEVACSSYRYVMTIQSERASGSARYDAFLNNSRLQPSSIQPPQ
jgi:hypothetical protein